MEAAGGYNLRAGGDRPVEERYGLREGEYDQREGRYEQREGQYDEREISNSNGYRKF
jgi:hypothetical protein